MTLDQAWLMSLLVPLPADAPAPAGLLEVALADAGIRASGPFWAWLAARRDPGPPHPGAFAAEPADDVREAWLSRADLTRDEVRAALDRDRTGVLNAARRAGHLLPGDPRGTTPEELLASLHTSPCGLACHDTARGRTRRDHRPRPVAAP